MHTTIDRIVLGVKIGIVSGIALISLDQQIYAQQPKVVLPTSPTTGFTQAKPGAAPTQGTIVGNTFYPTDGSKPTTMNYTPSQNTPNQEIIYKTNNTINKSPPTQNNAAEYLQKVDEMIRNKAPPQERIKILEMALRQKEKGELNASNEELGRIYSNLASTYHKIDDVKTAIYYFKKANEVTPSEIYIRNIKYLNDKL